MLRGLEEYQATTSNKAETSWVSDSSGDCEQIFRELTVKVVDLLLFLSLSDGRNKFHPNRNFVSEPKDFAEHVCSFRMTDEVERQVAENIWPHLDHAHFYALTPKILEPEGQVMKATIPMVCFCRFAGESWKNRVP